MKHQIILLLFVILLSANNTFANQVYQDNHDLQIVLQNVLDATQNVVCVQNDRNLLTICLPNKEARDITITFTLDNDNKIHVLEVNGGYGILNHYIKSSLEGKEIHAENVIPGINYIMTVKLPIAA